MAHHVLAGKSWAAPPLCLCQRWSLQQMEAQPCGMAQLWRQQQWRRVMQGSWGQEELQKRLR